jgi:hypothetical protein
MQAVSVFTQVALAAKPFARRVMILKVPDVFHTIFKRDDTCLLSQFVPTQIEPYNHYWVSMATPTIGGPLNVRGKEAPATISDPAHTYLSAGKQLQLKVSFEEYLHYASITRAEEKLADEAYRNARASSTIRSLLIDRFQTSREGPKAADTLNGQVTGPSHEIDEKNVQQTSSNPGSSHSPIDNQELHTANRALRTAGWGSVFYLITTDILGPSNTP